MPGHFELVSKRGYLCNIVWDRNIAAAETGKNTKISCRSQVGAVKTPVADFQLYAEKRVQDLRLVLTLRNI